MLPGFWQMTLALEPDDEGEVVASRLRGPVEVGPPEAEPERP